MSVPVGVVEGEDAKLSCTVDEEGKTYISDRAEFPAE